MLKVVRTRSDKAEIRKESTKGRFDTALRGAHPNGSPAVLFFYTPCGGQMPQVRIRQANDGLQILDDYTGKQKKKKDTELPEPTRQARPTLLTRWSINRRHPALNRQ
ncbi:hypothetical protein HAX54_020678 [Datura stramonium]|uniref:Uncharacterized protein n=1 Tax=Datura stramonium TaxID=4076 RepID=A0ABS8UTP0_DATST|nr:hypothetical protein [Datura stramonium]